MFFKSNADWSGRCESISSRLLTRFGEQGLNSDNFGFVALRENGFGEMPDGFAYRGDWRCYPCSLVKVFHLVHALNAIDTGRVADHEELSRAMRDMILWSSNTGTNYVIDAITGTSGNTLLDDSEFQGWREKREALNRFFQDLGWPEFETCNITQKLMDDIRYGREAQYAGRSGEYLNALTPLAAARLFHEIFSGAVPLSDASRARAKKILLRDRESMEARQPHFQVNDFLGGGVPAEADIWSKAGKNSWTGDPRASYYKHDLIRIAAPGKPAIIVCLMTQGKGICEDHPKVFPEMGKIFYEILLN
jgi:beta-lactamase class A